MLPGLPERNPGLELANAFSVKDQESSHSLCRVVVLTVWDRTLSIGTRFKLHLVWLDHRIAIMTQGIDTDD